MKVEIWSDVVCPWCYVGKRRFEAALRRFEHRDEVDVVWRSFELDPAAPLDGDVDLVGHLAAKYGVSRDEAQAMNDRVTRLAAEEGVTFRLDIARRGRTFDAHRLLHLAAHHGVQGTVKERLLAAYFTEGQSVTDHDALVRAAVAGGLDEATAREVVTGDRFTDEVRADEQEAQRLGVRAVPFFAIDRRIGVAGAQRADALLEALDEAWEGRQQVVQPAGG